METSEMELPHTRKTFWKSAFYMWRFLKERPNRGLAAMKYSHGAIVILDLIMFLYSTRSKISDISKKRLFFWTVLEPLAKNSLGYFGNEKEWIGLTYHFAGRENEYSLSLRSDFHSTRKQDWLRVRPIPQLRPGLAQRLGNAPASQALSLRHRPLMEWLQEQPLPRPALGKLTPKRREGMASSPAGMDWVRRPWSQRLPVPLIPGPTHSTGILEHLPYRCLVVWVC